MNIPEFKKLPKDELENLLGDALSKELNQSYPIPVEGQERDVIRAELADASVQTSFINEEFKVVKDGFKARLEPLQEIISNSVSALKTGVKIVTGTLFLLPDWDQKVVHTVDGVGNHISTRPMKPEERQHRLQLATGSADIHSKAV